MQKSDWIILSILGFVSALIYWPWFFTNGIFTWGDWGWYFSDTVRMWWEIPQIWLYNATGGVDISLVQYFPTKLLYSALSFLGPFELFDKFVFLIPSVIVPVFSAYFLGRKLFKHQFSAAICSLVFFLNSYSVNLRTGHFTLAVGFGFAPLIILFFIRILEKLSLRDVLLMGFFSWLSFAYEPRSYLLIGWIMAAYFIYFNLFISRPTIKLLIKRILYSFLPLLILILTSLYGLLGLHFSSGVITSQILNRGLFGSGYVNIQRGFALSIHSWTENYQNIRPDILYIVPHFWILPILSMLGLWVNRKNKRLMFWGLIALAGIFLVKQSNQPFENVYAFLFKYLPGFNAFREPSKFYFLIGISYSVLLSSFADYLLSSTRKSKLIIVSLIVLPLLANGIPVIQSQIGKLQTPRKTPEDYLIYKDFIKNNYGDYRTLYVPVDSRWGYWDKSVRKLNTVNFDVYEWPELANYHKEGLEYSPVDHTMSILEKDFSPLLLSQYGIRYVVIPLDDKENEDNFIFSWGDRKEFISRVSKLSYLRPVDLKTPELLVFENPSVRPILYWTTAPESLSVDQPFHRLDYKRLSSTEFDINLSQIPATSSVTLNFSEKYDPQWHFYPANSTWIQILFRLVQPIDAISNSQSPIHTNSFAFDLPVLKSQSADTLAVNLDGSYDLHLRLFYSPQALINLSSLISLVSLTAVIVGIIYLSYRKKYG